MRTTVTLDPDVSTEIERIQKRDGRRFKQVLNEALRIGLRQLSGTVADAIEPSRSPTVPVDLGAPLVDLVDVSAALAYADEFDTRDPAGLR
jgi:hypothetical protein